MVIVTPGSKPNCYTIVFDLHKAPRTRYRRLEKELHRLGDTVRATESHWLVATSLPASEVLRRVLLHLKKDDGYVITEFTGYQHHHGLSPHAVTWLIRYGFIMPTSPLRLAA